MGRAAPPPPRGLSLPPIYFTYLVKVTEQNGVWLPTPFRVPESLLRQALALTLPRSLSAETKKVLTGP